MLRSTKALLVCAALALAAAMCSSAASASVRLLASNIDWTTNGNNVRFQLHFENPDPAPSQAVTGVLSPQALGSFVPNSPTSRTFDVPPMQPNSFFDVFLDLPITALPQNPPNVVPGNDATGNGPCPPDGHWDGNVDVIWSGAGGVGEVHRHVGHIQVCPGGGCSYIHVVTGCSNLATWSIGGLCPGFSATLYNDDRVTAAPNPVPAGWTGWVCVTAAPGTPIPTTCCFTLRFVCAGAPAIVELCATTCDCRQTGANPVPGTIDWTTLPGTGTVRFHIRWNNPGSQMSLPITGNMHSQEFGVFLPNVGDIGSFSVPALSPNGSFDVFTDVALNQLPKTANQAGSGPDSHGPCPPDNHWDGNIDITWNSAAGGGHVDKHIGQIVVCPGSGASLIHVRSLTCGSALGMPWSISGLCPGFNATLVNEDLSPAPNPVPSGWTGWVSITAAAATPVPDSCCFQVTFMCDGVPGVVDLCAITCQCGPTHPNPIPGTIDWNTQPNGMVRFHVRWMNPSDTDPTEPATGNMMSQPFGLFLPDFGPIGQFDVPSIPPSSFFDVFMDVPLSQLPRQPARQLPGGGPQTGGPCPPDDHWDGNVDLIWNTPSGTAQVNKHVGTLLVNTGGGNSYVHVISGCALATGTSWMLAGVCPGFSVALENEDHSPAPNPLPPNWTGWLRVSASGLPPGTACCFTLNLHCGFELGVIELCAVTCYWGTLGVDSPRLTDLGFAIRGVLPNPTEGPAMVSFVLPTAGETKLEIFDAAGHRVRTMVEGTFGPGAHTARWDGRDVRGNLAKPGTYFVRLSSGERSASHKFVLRP